MQDLAPFGLILKASVFRFFLLAGEGGKVGCVNLHCLHLHKVQEAGCNTPLWLSQRRPGNQSQPRPLRNREHSVSLSTPEGVSDKSMQSYRNSLYY